ncbi:hypothetical protein EM868_10180 [Cupriavidus gilardii]|uniref:hypothetical protein n=1 Tax=Cupriavidus gilardii TaxID=82541 RepID=UPI00157475DC|nr:hypothetical protein [Cupriavidus gilardii]MCG5261972.1 hypothetical protein [Cupriavidus gilardii]MDF9430161.1 hypothetical protein [Cupriavidus gilardii]NSX05833.1 hypothetical protein [Cupriavidus gilardii]
MIRILIAPFSTARLATVVLGVAALFATAGCERSQPGPKPISGDTPAADTAPSTNPPARKE